MRSAREKKRISSRTVYVGKTKNGNVIPEVPREKGSNASDYGSPLSNARRKACGTALLCEPEKKSDKTRPLTISVRGRKNRERKDSTSAAQRGMRRFRSKALFYFELGGKETDRRTHEEKDLSRRVCTGEIK